MKFKFITLNILHGGELMDKVIEFLSAEKPDLLFLQEAQETDFKTEVPNFNTMLELQKHLSFPHNLFSPQLEMESDGVPLRHGNAIFSQFPLTEHEPIFFDSIYKKVDHAAMAAAQDFSSNPQSMQCAETIIAGKTISLFNVHGIWAKDGFDSARRLKMSDLIVNEIKDKPHCILAGDFNVQPNTQTIKNIEKYLMSVFGTSLNSTFNMRIKTNPGYATAAVDQIFLSRSFKVVEAHSPQVHISDHLPLVAELEL